MKRVVLPALVLLGACCLQAQDKNAVLQRMDQSAPNFHAMSANIQMTTLTAIINDKTVEDGTLRMRREKTGDVNAVLDFSGAKTDARQIGFFGRMIRIYYPRAKTYQDFDVGKNTNVLNQVLLLGFGSSGKDLERSYEVSAEGRENLAGVATTKLLLIPKDPEVRKRLSKIEMWIPDDAAYPIKQQFYEPSGNYRSVAYSNIKLGSSAKGKLELKLPSDAKKQGNQQP